MSDELRLAAKRLVGNCWTNYLGEPPPTGYRDWARIVDQILTDARVVARYVLTLQPASESVNTKLLDACERACQVCEQLSEQQAMSDNSWIGSITTVRSAIAAARVQAADDAIPVDEAWLRWIGFSGSYTLRISEEITAAPQVCFRKFEIGDTCWIQNKDPIKSVITNIEIPRPKTRGDVRRLLAALGVEK